MPGTRSRLHDFWVTSVIDRVRAGVKTAVLLSQFFDTDWVVVGKVAASSEVSVRLPTGATMMLHAFFERLRRGTQPPFLEEAQQSEAETAEHDAAEAETQGRQ